MDNLTLKEFLVNIFTQPSLYEDLLMKLNCIGVDFIEDLEQKEDLILLEVGIQPLQIQEIRKVYQQISEQTTQKNFQKEEQTSTIDETTHSYADPQNYQTINTEMSPDYTNINKSDSEPQYPSQDNPPQYEEEKVENKITRNQDEAMENNSFENNQNIVLTPEFNIIENYEQSAQQNQTNFTSDIETNQNSITEQLDNIQNQAGREIKLEYFEIFKEFFQVVNKKSLAQLEAFLTKVDDLNLKNLILSVLEEKFVDQFDKLCIDTTFFEDSEYSKTLKQIQLFQKAKKIDKCNQSLTKLYGTNKMAAIALYKKMYLQIDGLKDPKLLVAIEKSIDTLQTLTIPQSCQDTFEMIISSLQENDLDNVLEFFTILESSGEEEKSFTKQIAPILQAVIPKLQRIVEIRSFFDKLDGSNGMKQIFEQLCDSIIQMEDKNIVKFFKQLIKTDPKIAIIVYPIINVYYPQISNMISYASIFLAQAPNNIKINLQQIFDIINSNESTNSEINLEQDQIESLHILLKDVYYRSPYFYQFFFDNYIKTNQRLCDLQQPESLEQLCIKSLAKINKMLKFQDKTIFNITNFMTVNSEFDGQTLQQEICFHYKHHDQIQAEPLKILLFDYIKRRCTFSELISALSKTKSSCEVTRQILFNFLKKNSDQYLRTLLYMASSSFMPIPLVSYDWEDQQRKPIVCEELFYTFEKYKAVFTFKLSTNTNQGPIGCTSLINDVFQKDFEKHKEELTNFGCIDIQFDYNFASPMCIPVADAQGYLSSEILRKSYVLFDIFVIHIHNTEENQILLNEEIKFLKHINQNCIIVVIEHDEAKNKKGFQYEVIDKSIHIIKTYPYDNLLEQEKINLKDKVFSIIQPEIKNFEDYKGDYFQRINSMKLFNQFLSNFSVDNGFIEQALDLTTGFLQEIEANANDLHSENFLPMNYFNESICQIQKQLLRESEINENTRESLRSDIDDLKERMQMKEETKILVIFQKILDFKNFLGLISIIAKLLKGLLEKQLNPLLIERTLLRSSLQNQNLDKSQKEEIMRNMEEYSTKIEARWFSAEFIYRELYLFGQNTKINSNKHEQLYRELTELQISQAQPFEIIDGNNLQFISNVYEKIYQDNQDQILVVAVMGPQSSGKSLLLNFLFGTQFQSAAGRCTKGVYASLLDISSTSQTKYKKILILDTEGIQAAEGRDDQFDKRIVFYILCVSHVILICNKGEMNNQMSEVIKLATDAISALKETIIQAPSINIVMNMLAQINESAMEESIQKLSNAILEMGNGEHINKLFQINKENVFNLPYAFDRSGKDQMIVNQPSQDFTRKLEPLRRKILDRVFQFDQMQQSNFTLYEWFTFACNFWTFTSSFKGITDYSTLDQKKQDLKIIDKISSLVDEYFGDKTQEHREYLRKNLQEIFNKYEGTCVIKIETIAIEAKGIIDSKYQLLTKEIEEQFQKYCGDQNINTSIRDKRKSHLFRSMDYHRTDWLSYINQEIAVFSDKKSKIIGDSRLQKYLYGAIKEKDVYQPYEAEEKFNEAWLVIEQEVKQMLKSKDHIYNDVFQLIHSHYKNEILDKHFENIDLEKQYLTNFKKQSRQCFVNYLQDNKKSIFFFIGNQTIPNIDNIIRILSLQRTYSNQIPTNLFTLSNKTNYYDWHQVIYDRFKFHLLNINLEKAYSTTKRELKSAFQAKRATDMEQLTQIYQKIKNEACFFDIAVKEDFYLLIINIEEKVKYECQLPPQQNPSKYRINEAGNEFQSAACYFFKMIDWDKVVRQLEEIVLEKYKVDGIVEQHETIQKWVEKLKEAKHIDQKIKFCGITRKLIQNIAKSIKVLISQIDDEIEPFCLKISETGTQIMHLIAQTFVNTLAEQLELMAEHTPLEILSASREIQKDIFIAKLTSNDKATDQGLAANIAKNLQEIIIKQNSQRIKQNFKKQMNLMRDNFKKLNIIKDIENGAIQASKSTEQMDDELDQINDYDEHSSEEESDSQFKSNKYKFIVGPLKTRSQIEKMPKQQITQKIDIGESEKDFNIICKEAVSFYVDPKTLLKQKFNQQWKEIAGVQIELINSTRLGKKVNFKIS